MDAREVIRSAFEICLETIITVGEIFAMPWRADAYCAKVGLPPLALNTDWTSSAVELRAQLSATEDPAELVSDVIAVIDHVKLSLEAIEEGDAAQIARQIFAPAILRVLRRYDHKAAVWIYALLVGAIVVDERLAEAYPNTTDDARWCRLWDDARSAAGEVQWTVRIAAAAELISFVGPWFLQTFVRPALTETSKREHEFKWPFEVFFHFGFDQHPAVQGLDETFDAAHHAFVAFVGWPDHKLTQADYQAFDPLEPTRKPHQLAFAFVPAIAVPDGPNAHAGGLYVQATGSLRHEDDSSAQGLRDKIEITGEGGALFLSGDPPYAGNKLIGAFGLDNQIIYESPPADTEGDETSFRIGRAVFEVGCTVATAVAGSDLWARLRFEKVDVHLASIPLLDFLLPSPSGLRISFDAGVIASLRRGIGFEGGLGGDVVIPIDQTIDLWIFEARIRDVHVKLDVAAVEPRDPEEEERRELRIDVTAGLTLSLGDVVSVTIEGMGIRWALAPRDHRFDGNFAGIADLRSEIVAPNGIGVRIAAGFIEGGGAFLYEPDAHRLSGGAEIAIKPWVTLKAFGVYESLENGRKSWLLIASIQWHASESCFALTGVGMLYGSNRRTDPEAFLAGVAAGDLDVVLFPENPIDNVSRYTGVVGRLFPVAEGGEVVGICAAFQAFASRLEIKVGLIVDSMSRFYLIAQVTARFPVREVPVIDLHADGVGVWDSARADEFQLRLALRNSKFFGADAFGEAMIFRGDPDLEDHQFEKATFTSIGGYHPSYTIPSGRIYVPKRLELTISRGDHLRFDWQQYLALTPGAFHFGVAADLVALFSGFGIRGHLSTDALFTSISHFVIDIELSIELLLGSRTIAGVAAKLTIAGVSPTTLSGRVSVSFLFLSWTSPPFDIVLIVGQAVAAVVDIVQQLQQAASDSALFEPGGVNGCTLSAAARSGIWASPSEPLRFRQTVVPLQRPITRFGEAVLAAPETYTIEPVANQWRSLDGEFAPVAFLDLTPEQKLAARSFEAMPAGFEILREHELGAITTTDLGYENVVIDPDNEVPAPPTIPLPADLQAAASSLRGGVSRPRKRAPSLRRERFAVVDRELQVVHGATSFADAHGKAVGDHMIIPESEAA